ncbi:unnamed protein product [Pieris brassicae]|uniref:Uncharacterized protein n=1 Tax=Pieris brassicae TaxID=7116 RepID=A0A9P0TJQ4_PIEBR|nr:unnamed protein product [Pieris brassicae]
MFGNVQPVRAKSQKGRYISEATQDPLSPKKASPRMNEALIQKYHSILLKETQECRQEMNNRFEEQGKQYKELQGRFNRSETELKELRKSIMVIMENTFEVETLQGHELKRNVNSLNNCSLDKCPIAGTQCQTRYFTGVVCECYKTEPEPNKK